MGTGKSDTSYRIFSRLYQQGTPIARLDLDDIGMSHPAPSDDPHNFAVKAAPMSPAGTSCAPTGSAMADSHHEHEERTHVTEGSRQSPPRRLEDIER